MSPSHLEELLDRIEAADTELTELNARTIRTRRDLAQAYENVRIAQAADNEAHRARENASDRLRNLRADYELLVEH